MYTQGSRVSLHSRISLYFHTLRNANCYEMCKIIFRRILLVNVKNSTTCTKNIAMRDAHCKSNLSVDFFYRDCTCISRNVLIDAFGYVLFIELHSKK